MKVIDQTPLQDEKGQIGILQRVQGSLKYGFDWYADMEAQKSVLAHLARVLGKNYIAVRNQTLGASGITVPVALVGPAGIYAVSVTNVRGTYQATGDEWEQVLGSNAQPARVNVIKRTKLFARALQAFIERQGVKLPKPVEPIILAANPGLHAELTKSNVRIIMVDAIERWAASLETSASVLTVETAHELADRIVNPRPVKKGEQPEAAPAPVESESESQPSRASAIFRAADEAPPFNPAELDFALEDGADLNLSPEMGDSEDTSSANAKKRFLGMTVPQLALLGGIALVEICVVAGFAIMLYLNQ